MTPERWKEVEDLFGRGLVDSAEEREGLLRGVDPELAGAVRQLWRQHEDAGSFLREPAVSPDPVRTLQAGQNLGGRFTILEFIGSGGMGEVYKVRDERLGRLVAIKALNTTFAERVEFRQRIEREARAICALNHPRICSLYDLCWEGNQPFLVMEYLSGPTLAERLSCGRLPLDELLGIADSVADGLAYAHERGVVHRDLKPANIILTDIGVKLLDFGIAKQHRVVAPQDDTETMTAEGTIVGTAAYMSPEQAEAKTVDARSDVFSFGALLYEMATGTRAFQGDSPVSTLAAILHLEPAPIRTLAPASPPELDHVIRRCLKKRSEDRYANGLEIRKDLQRLAKKSNRAVWVFGGLAAALAATLLAAVVLRTKPSTAPIAIPRPVQLTRDRGMTADPSISPDGKLVAYVSNRGETGKFGVWVQAIDSGKAIQIVRGCEYASDALFTPDGTKILYVCGTVEKPVLYEVPARGGTPRLLAENAVWPSISADGKWLAYLTGKPPLLNRLSVMQLPDGKPEQPCPACLVMYRALWSPDSQNLFFYGWAEEPTNEIIFWSLPRAGGPPRRSELNQLLGIPAAPEHPLLIGWDRSNNIYLSYEVQAMRDLWRVPVTELGLRATGPAIPVTSGMRVWNASFSGERLVFDTNTASTNLRYSQMDADGARLIGNTEPLTSDEAMNISPSLAEDGRTAIYLSTRSGDKQIIRRNMETAEETPLGNLAPGKIDYCASRDGRWIAWAAGSREKPSISYSSIAKFEPVKLCEACGYPVGWLWNNSSILIAGHPRQPNALMLRDLRSGGMRLVLEGENPEVRVADGARVSYDGKWLAFRWFENLEAMPRIYIAPLAEALPVERRRWILATEDNSGNVDWSPNGRSLFFTGNSGRDILAVPLNPDTKYPTGPPISIYRSDENHFIGYGLATSRGSMIFSDASMLSGSNIWLQELRR